MVFPFKDKELNRIAAFFHTATFLLTCAALVQPSWFRIRGVHCSPHLSLSQFFSFDDDDYTPSQRYRFTSEYGTLSIQDPEDEPPCITPDIVNLMRSLILLCFMVLLCSFFGVILNLTNVSSKALRLIRRNAILSILCVFWVIAIVGVCYYTTVILETQGDTPPRTIQVDYEYGFYTITAAGALSLVATAANLWTAPEPSDDIQRRNLVDDWDGHEPYAMGPTPNVPTLPPYTPRPIDYIPRHTPIINHQRQLPPAFNNMDQYFPFDDLSILPPPPPYTP